MFIRKFMLFPVWLLCNLVVRIVSFNRNHFRMDIFAREADTGSYVFSGLFYGGFILFILWLGRRF